MALWGASVSETVHVRNAVLAGLEMQATMRALRSQFRARGWPELHIGAGVNTGRMSVGNGGSEARIADTVMEHAVNLASHLDGLTKQSAVLMIVGAVTRTACPDNTFRELDHLRVDLRQNSPGADRDGSRAFDTK